MNTIYKLTTPLLLAICIVFAGCDPGTEKLEVSSPDGRTEVSFTIQNDTPQYMVARDSKTVVSASNMGFTVKDSLLIGKGLKIKSFTKNEKNEYWNTLWGSKTEIKNHYNELNISLLKEEKDTIQINIIFRLFNDGMAFRYHINKVNQADSLVVIDENTEFKMNGDHECWWIPANYDSYEHLTTHSKLSEIKVTTEQLNCGMVDGIRNLYAVHTPLTMKTSNNIHLSLHQAALYNFPAMTLEMNTKTNTLKSNLVPSANGGKAKIPIPFMTPWRTLQISDNAGGLIESDLILNLNDPQKPDVDWSWVKPTKYMGIWWALHIAKYSFYPGEKHGATTQHAFEYIDFASANGIKGLLIEGWDKSILNFNGHKGIPTDFQSPTDDFDINKVTAYAKEKGVELVSCQLDIVA
jgi:hypothetical protein